MIKFTHYSLPIFLLGLALSCQAMEQAPKGNGHKTKLLFSDKNKLFNEIKSNLQPEEGSVSNMFGASPFLGKKATKAFQETIKENPEIKAQFVLGRGSKKHEEPLKAAGTTLAIKNSIHAKYIAVSVKQQNDESEESEKLVPIQKTICTIQSDNMSDTSVNNEEAMAVFEDPEVYTQLESIHKKFMECTTPVKGTKKQVYTTPEKVTLADSFGFDLNASKRARFDKLAQTDNPNDRLMISSMTFDEESLVDHLTEINKKRTNALKPELFLNADALNHKELLQKALDSGAQIYIRHEEPQWPGAPMNKIQHTKLIALKAGDNYLSTLSTGNWTEQSNTERNIDAVIPQDEDVYNETVSFLERLKTRSTLLDQTSLDDLVQKREEKKQIAREKKAAKRKAQSEAEETENDKNSTEKPNPRKKSCKKVLFLEDDNNKS